MFRTWLIARREFTAFSDGATFWVALLFGPLVTALTGLAGVGLPTGAGPLLAAKAVGGPEALAHLLAALFLWLTLVTSLGMLLQAVVRERTSRSLETLLAAVRPHEILLGKMAGVGAVSAVVMAAWLGGMLVLALTAAARGASLAPAPLLHAAADPWLAVQAVFLFAGAFAFYGALISVVGVAARDEAGAQNLARPLFGVLLLIFFGALTATGMRASPPDWLVWVPPLTPFMLLLKPGLLPPAGWVLALAQVLGAAAFMLWAGGRLLSGQGLRPNSPAVAQAVAAAEPETA